MKYFILLLFFSCILSIKAKNQSIDHDLLMESVLLLEERGEYLKAKELILENFSAQNQNWFDLSKELLSINEKLNLYADNLDLFNQGHKQKYFYFIHSQIPKYKPYLEFPGFDSIISRDLKLRDEAIALAKTIYQVQLPSSYGLPGKLQAIFIFHGGGKDILDARQHWDVPILNEHYIKIFLQSYRHVDYNTYGWGTSDVRLDQDIRQIYAEVCSNYPIDTSEILAGGISAGASAAIDLSLRSVLPSKGLIAYCPDLPKFLKDRDFELLTNPNAAVFVSTGESDGFLAKQRQMAEIFDSLKIRNKLVIEPMRGHEYPESEPQQVLDALDFISGNTQPGTNNEFSAGSLSFDDIIEGNPGLDYDYMSITQGVRYCVPGIKLLFEDIEQIPHFAETIAGNIQKEIDHPQTMMHLAFRTLGASAGGFGPPLALENNRDEVTGNSELDILTYLKRELGFIFEKGGNDEWKKLPQDFRLEILKTVLVIDQACNILNQFKDPIINELNLEKPIDNKALSRILSLPWNSRQLDDFSSIDVLSFIDLKKLSFASRMLTEQIWKLAGRNDLLAVNDFTKCIIKTDLGSLGIYGLASDSLQPYHFLAIDLGGDDHYSGAIASSFSSSCAIGVLIDYSGNDTYDGSAGYLASGIMGCGFLFDLKGDDLYQSGSEGIASSIYGASMLYDADGNDIYSSDGDYSQASARVGVAMLVDLKGDDHYYSKNYAQGFGSTLGAGLLIDAQGNDIYTGFSPAGDNTRHSFKFVQGASKGRWAEATDGQSLGGGYGFLVDLSGDDSFYAESFSQGSGYYFGLGHLIDKSGDDHFNALSHSQGYAAHFALAGFIDQAGNDHYNANSDTNRITQIIGSGRDFSAGWFVEVSGNDTYHFGNRSAGIGDLDGLGYLIDLSGDDRYFWHKNNLNRNSPSLGRSIGQEGQMMTNYRLYLPKKVECHGVFYDISGKEMIVK